MKKIFSKRILSAMILAAFALSSISAKKRVKTVEEIPDAYGEEAEVTEITEVTPIEVETKKKSKKSKYDPSDPYNKQKMEGKDTRSGVQRAFNLNKFQRIESFSLYSRNVFGKFTARKAHLIHRAGTDIGGFVSYYDTAAYAVQFSTTARATLRSAIDQYFIDFDEKNLDKKAKKTNRIYGHCEGYEDFGTAIGMMQDFARPRIHFGYLFMKNNPYFVIYIPKTENLKKTGSTEYDDMKKDVIPQTYYFTKAQAKRLYDFLSDENIMALKGSIDDETLDENEIRVDTLDDPTATTTE